MWSITLFVPTIVAAVLADAAANGRVIPIAQAAASQSESTKAASVKPLRNGKGKRRDVSDESGSAYQQLLATHEKFKKLLDRQPEAIVALQRYPILLRKQLRALVKAHGRAVEHGQKSQKAHAASSAQSLHGAVASNPIPRTLKDREQTTDSTHRAPAPAELRKRAQRSLQNVPTIWVLRASGRAEALLKQIAASLEQKEYDATQLKKQLDELDRAFESIARPVETRASDPKTSRKH